MAVPLIFKSDLHIKSLAISTALTPREGHYFLKMHEFLPFSVEDSSCAARRIRFRGLISGRETVNTLKSRTERTLLTISPQFALNDPALHLTLILLNLAREPFERGVSCR